MDAYLTIEAGQGEPRVSPLPRNQKLTLGRHRNNTVVLQDEHASRWHAEIFVEGEVWYIRDFGALNGTRVNGETITKQTPLIDGSIISIGKTALRFSLEPAANGNPCAATAELRKQGPASDSQPIAEIDQTVLCNDELTALCQFMAASVKETDPRALILRALETVRSQTRAAVTGYLSLDPDDPEPKLVLPKLARVDIHLSRRLTQEVQRQNRTVCLSAHPDDVPDSESLLAYADALCLPLWGTETALGALHVYRSPQRFNEREVRFCEVLAGHLASSLHLLRVQRTLQAENSRLRSHSPGPDQLVGNSPVMQALRERIARFAPRSSTVLVVGESGVGKELVALALHGQSPRREGPLVSVNCAAIAPTLLESELFGHRKGAFSGADSDHPGLFEQADEGTLFLDEIGELSLECQAKLLRVLEGKGFRPVGATAEIEVDVRIVAATNRDLEGEVRADRFRKDLFFRLQGMQIPVPPLREHLDDLPALVDYFLTKLNDEWDRQVRVSDSVLQRLREYSWPGNVRQLRSVLENAVALSEREILGPADVHLSAGSNPGEPLSLNLEELEQWAIRQALRRTAGNITHAAGLLGVVRDTLASKMKKYSIAKDGS